jgi:hypothetical protein
VNFNKGYLPLWDEEGKLQILRASDVAAHQLKPRKGQQPFALQSNSSTPVWQTL